MAPIRGALVSAEGLGRRWAEGLGLHDPTPEQLRALPLDEVVKGRGFPFVDGRVVAQSPGEGFRAADEMRIPFIIGSNTHEATLATNTEANAKAVLGEAYPDLLAAFTAQPTTSRSTPAVRLSEDALSVQASLAVAEMHAANGAPTWAYRFGEVPVDERATSEGAPHGAEMEYLFVTKPADEKWDAQDRRASQLIGDYWVRFAKTSDPSGPGSPLWRRLAGRPTPVLAIGEDTRTVTSSPIEERTRDAALQSAVRRWASTPPAR